MPPITPQKITPQKITPQTRRSFLVTAAASAGALSAGAITVLPWAARAQGQEGDVFETAAGEIIVHPVEHASFVLETPAGVILVDPVGDPALYADLPAPDLILVTHEHGDHYSAETLAALRGEAHLITNPAVNGMLPDELKESAEVLANGENTSWASVVIDAIPAYNTTEERKAFHPQGRDNGYVLTFDGFRVYISGDTEDIPEMRALENIDLAFLCMNLPFTMDAAQAADAVKAFGPRFVYPYHYRGRDDGSQDPEEFAALVGDAAEVRISGWYEAPPGG